MKEIYSKTYYFWIITRILIIVFCSIDVCSLISKFGFSLLYCVEIVYVLTNAVLLYRALLQLSPIIILNYVVGTLSIGLGLFLFYWKFTEPKPTWGIAKYQFDYVRLFCYIASGWLIAFGVFDFLVINKETEE
ncbi:hypothetical protein [Flavobacterium sp. GCM10027622]|uniref:hypothetical protein n=1 Tax=unclassified Flavobacterium TaxID=196869 RepID=UPI00361EA6A0